MTSPDAKTAERPRSAKPVNIPVVMLHSVVGRRPDRPPTFPVWCPPEIFERYLRWMKRRGFTTITLDEMHAHLEEGAPIPRKPIILTFDDAYLDNWVYAAPLLRRYGFRATVFAPTDFIEESDTTRPTMDDVRAGRLAESELEAYGYMNSAELRALAQEGVIDVQSHGQTHTWLPVSDEIVDFHRPGLPMGHLRWMWWNRHPERKARWFSEISHDDIPFGAPVYRCDLALAERAVSVDPTLEDRLTRHVAEQGGARFFEREGWKRELEALVEAHRRETGRTEQRESDASFGARLVAELRGSREKLEAWTGKPVRFMCWPNGGVCDEAFALLEESGYRACTFPSRFGTRFNRRGKTQANRIGRISATSFFRGKETPWLWLLSFVLKVERNRGYLWPEIPIKAIWLLRRFVKPGGAEPHGAGI